MWAGFVPQQPPTTFRKPARAHSPRLAAIDSGVSSKPPKAFGRPAFGYALTKQGAMRESSSRCGRISFGPRAQLMPTERSGAWETEIQKASTVWPERLRPERSVIVTDAITGRRTPRTSNARSIAARAAFAFSVSKAVSTRRMSAPPSSRPSACS